MKRLLTIFLLFCATTGAFGQDLLTTTGVYRLTHEAYRAGNIYFAVRSRAAWNVDYTRMMLWEETAYTHPTYGVTGRGLVWGRLDSLKQGTAKGWNTLAEYHARSRIVPNWTNITNPKAAFWSPFPGEANIIYAPFDTGAGAMLRKINVDTGVATDIIDVSAPGSIEESNMLCYEWTRDSTLVCSFGYEDFSNGGWEINVKTPSKVSVSSAPAIFCNSAYQQWANDWITHGHGSTSPSGRWFANNYGSGYGVNKGVYDLDNNCAGPNLDLNRSPNPYAVHVSWKYAEDWYLGSDCGNCSWQSAPHIEDFHIYQILWDSQAQSFTYRLLVTQASADRWQTSSGAFDHYNFSAIPIATGSRDGTMAVFLSTNGKYSYDDYTATGVTPWGYEGIFLAEFSGIPQNQDYQIGWHNALDYVYIKNDFATFNNFTTSASMSAARNERESAQLIVKATAALSNVTVTPSSLSNGQGGFIPSSNVTVYPVGQINVGADDAPGWPETHGYHPGPILSHLSSVNIASGDQQQFWVTVYVPPGTVAGTYNGTLAVSATGQASTNMNLSFEVYDFTLPDTASLNTIYSVDEKRGFDQVVGQPINSTERQALYNLLLDHKLGSLSSLYGITLRAADVIAVGNARWINDYQVHRQFLDRNEIINNTIEVVQGLSNERVQDVAQSIAGLSSIGFDFSGDTSRQVIWYTADELDEQEDGPGFPKLRAALKIWRNYFDGSSSARPYLPIATSARLNIWTAANADTFAGERYVDVFMTAASDFVDPSYVQANYPWFETWWYTANFPASPNWFITTNDLIESAMLLGPVTWANFEEKGAPNGWMHWSLNDNDTWNNAVMSRSGTGSYVNWQPYRLPGDCGSSGLKCSVGSGEVVYIADNEAGGYKFLPDVRLAAIREGLEFYDYYAILKQAIADNPSSPQVTLANTVVDVRSYLVFNTSNAANFSHDYSDWATAREEVADLIVALYGGAPPDPSITVSAANGGEDWPIDATRTITWTSSGSIANVKIELSRDGGSTYETVTASTTNDGSHPWQVTGAATTQARLRISDVLASSTNDVSNSDFTISTATTATITVTSPNGGESWAIGTSHLITWSNTGSIANVKIELSRNDGASYSTLFASTANDGSEAWTVTTPTTQIGIIKISDASDATVVDSSDFNFTIASAPSAIGATTGKVILTQPMWSKVPFLETNVDTSELFQNGNHEAAIASINTYTVAISGNVSRVTSRKYGGLYSTKFASDGVSCPEHSIAFGVDPATNGFFADSTYLISNYVWIDPDSAGTVYLYVWDGSTLNQIDSTVVTGAWVLLEGEYTVPASPTQVSVELHIVGTAIGNTELITNGTHEAATATLNGQVGARRGTIAKVSDQKYQGSFSTKFTGNDSTGSKGIIMGANNALNGFDLDATYTFRARVRIDSANAGQVYMYLWDGTQLNAIQSTSAVNSWVLLKGNHTMPSNSSEIKLEFHGEGNDGIVFWVDSTSVSGPGGGSGLHKGVFYFDNNSATIKTTEPAPPTPPPIELITDGDFEADSARINNFGAAIAGTYTQSTEQKHAGSNSGKYKGDGSTTGEHGIRFGPTSNMNGFEVGVMYDIVGWVYLPGGQTSSKISFALDWYDGTETQSWTVASTSDTSQWALLQAGFTVPSDAANFVRFKIVSDLTAASSDSFYIDDLEINKSVIQWDLPRSVYNYYPPFPWIAQITFRGSRAAEYLYEHFDWINTRYYRYDTIDSLRTAYPSKILGVDFDEVAEGIEGDIVKNFPGDVWPDEWFVKTPGGDHIYLFGSARLLDISDYCPVDTTYKGVLRFNEFLPRALADFADTTKVSVAFPDYWTTNGGWGTQVDSIDYDRNGVADNSEVGKSVKTFQAQANQALIREFRESWPDKYLVAHEAGENGSGAILPESDSLNGLGDENWRGLSWNYNQNTYLEAFRLSPRTPRLNFLEGAVRYNDSDSLTVAMKDNFPLMRFGLGSAALKNAYYGMDEGSYSHRFVLVYDEYLGNLGYPTGEQTELATDPGVYVRYFDRGAVIVNASGASATVATGELDGRSYYYFRGGQDTTMNKGGAFSSQVLAGSGGTGGNQRGDGLMIFTHQDTLIADLWIDNTEYNVTSPGQNAATYYGGNWANGTITGKAFSVAGIEWSEHDLGTPFKYVSPGAADSVVYNINIRNSGQYLLSLWWPDMNAQNVGSFSTKVDFKVFHGGSPSCSVGTFDQTKTPGRWVDIGTFQFNVGETNKLVIYTENADDGTVVVSDALRVRWVP